MGRLRCLWRLPACQRQRLGARQAAGDQRHLGRRPALCGVALQNDRQDLSAALRGGMGICGARRNADGIFLGRRDRQGQRQLQRLRQPVGRQADRPRSARSPPMRSAFTTCTAMSGNGSRIASTAITAAHPRMARRGRQVVTVITVSFAAVPGTPSREPPLGPPRRARHRLPDNDVGFRVGRTLTP